MLHIEYLDCKLLVVACLGSSHGGNRYRCQHNVKAWLMSERRGGIGVGTIKTLIDGFAENSDITTNERYKVVYNLLCGRLITPSMTGRCATISCLTYRRSRLNVEADWRGW